jgi:diguanylate cyclase (GGDEF)-like protein
MVDIDDMKGINDTAGHPAGDAALKLVADCLRRATRSTDVVARYGGDEFVVVLPNIAAGGARVVADRIVELVRSDRTAHVTVSVGVASLLAPPAHEGRKMRAQPESYFEAVEQQLLALVDQALYTAKRGGRDRVAEVEPAVWPPLADGAKAVPS